MEKINIIYNPQLDDIILTDYIGFDTEFNSLDTKHARLICFSITNQKGQTYVCDLWHYKKDLLALFFKKVAQIKMVIAHHAKVDVGVIYSNLGVLLRNCWCTMLSSQICDNGFGYKVKKELAIEHGYKPEDGSDNSVIFHTRSMVGNIPFMQHPHGLIACLKRYLGTVAIKQLDKKLLQQSFIKYDFKQPLTIEQLDYAAEDTVYLIPLHIAEWAHLDKRNLLRIADMENKLTPVLVKMEFRGCKIDIELHKKNIIKWKLDLHETIAKLDKILIDLLPKYPGIGKFSFDHTQTIVHQADLFGLPKEIIASREAFNYSSPKQLQDLFTACGQDQPMDDKKGTVSFGEESIAFYVTNNPQSDFVDFLNLLLKHREYEKLLGTYSQKILDQLDGDRIRTSYSQCFAETGRLASSEIIKDSMGLNLANIPKNPDIRKIFIPDEGFVFVDSDMTGQELVLAGDYSKEPVLLKAFQEGFDHHSFLASISYSLIFGQEVEIKNKSEKITIANHTYDIKKLRDVHKNCLFSKIYLGGPKRVQAYLNEYLVNHVPAEERYNICKQISDALDGKLKTLMKYLKGIVELTKQQGYVVANKLGRRRYFENPQSVYGNSCNVKIQGSGADSMKIALINLDKFFVTKSVELNISEDELGWLSMSVYDQCLCNFNKKYLEYDEAGKPKGLVLEIPKIMGNALGYFLTTLEGKSDLNIRTYWGK